MGRGNENKRKDTDIGFNFSFLACSEHSRFFLVVKFNRGESLVLFSLVEKFSNVFLRLHARICSEEPSMTSRELENCLLQAFIDLQLLT